MLSEKCFSYAGLYCNFYFFSVYVGQRVINKLRQKMFGAILKQEIAFFDKTSTGELVNRLASDTNLVGKAITDNISDGLRSVAQAVAGVSLMVSTLFSSYNTKS